MQTDPDKTGLNGFRDEGRYNAMAMHHAHIAAVLVTAGGGIAA
jgi:hypothetical protein